MGSRCTLSAPHRPKVEQERGCILGTRNDDELPGDVRLKLLQEVRSALFPFPRFWGVDSHLHHTTVDHPAPHLLTVVELNGFTRCLLFCQMELQQQVEDARREAADLTAETKRLQVTQYQSHRGGEGWSVPAVTITRVKQYVASPLSTRSSVCETNVETRTTNTNCLHLLSSQRGCT